MACKMLSLKDMWQTKVHFLLKLGLHSFEVYNHKQQTSFLAHLRMYMLINMFQQVAKLAIHYKVQSMITFYITWHMRECPQH